ncbi:MAG TPA: hypothetical protein PKA90_01760 [Ignavibacteria bacterium]|nr:hypothetical protein [Ignavibacteria bacterium]HMR39133.1 hypothetical protein [Ignavibacteria bacterium]
MSAKIGIGIIHGMGTQNKNFANTLINDLKSYYGEKNDTKDLYFRSVFWADILQKSENALWKNLKMDDLSFDKLRHFVVHYLADTIAYQKMYEEKKAESKNDRTVYFRIQERISEALKDIDENTEPDAPLVLIGHSLGTVMLLNYIYDSQKSPAQKKTIYWNGKTETGNLAGLILCGSPFALWTLRKEGFGEAINFPGEKVKGNLKTISKWVNFYDKDDVLGFPIKNINSSYKKNKQLIDIPVEVDNPVLGWTPLSHDDYFRTISIIKSISGFLQNVRNKIN